MSSANFKLFLTPPPSAVISADLTGEEVDLINALSDKKNKQMRSIEIDTKILHKMTQKP